MVEIVGTQGVRRFESPLLLRSGDRSRFFVDSKLALADGEDARLAAEAVLEVLSEASVEFDAVGGLTMGADILAHGVAIVAGRGVEWFSVRKATKDRGTKQRIEGARLTEGRRVVLLDDVVTRGSSIHEALTEIRASGASVVAAVTLVDRGEFGNEMFRREGVPYYAVVTYADLGIPAVGTESDDPVAAPR